jgi:putative transposase
MGKEIRQGIRDQIRERAPHRGDQWHMDEVVVSIASETYWLWRAVDQNGFVLDVLVQRRRDARAAQRLMTKLLKSAVTPPRVMITDKLRSYGAARAKMGFRVEHRQHKGLNNRAKNSHQPTRRRERGSNQPDRHNGFCRFTIKSRTSSTFPIQNPSLPTPAALRESNHHQRPSHQSGRDARSQCAFRRE